MDTPPLSILVGGSYNQWRQEVSRTSRKATLCVLYISDQLTAAIHANVGLENDVDVEAASLPILESSWSEIIFTIDSAQLHWGEE